MAQEETGQATDITMEQNVVEQNPPSITNTFNSGYGMVIEAITTVAQIIACTVVLAVSGDEKPHKPLRIWVVVYFCVSVASLPLLYWRHRHLRKTAAQASAQAHMQTLLRNQSIDLLRPWNASSLAWFIVGCVWIFSGTLSRSVAPHLYWMTLAIVIIYIAGYVLRFLICSAMCCCFSCTLVVIGLTQDSGETSGATPETAPKDQLSKGSIISLCPHFLPFRLPDLPFL